MVFFTLTLCYSRAHTAKVLTHRQKQRLVRSRVLWYLQTFLASRDSLQVLTIEGVGDNGAFIWRGLL